MDYPTFSLAIITRSYHHGSSSLAIRHHPRPISFAERASRETQPLQISVREIENSSIIFKHSYLRRILFLYLEFYLFSYLTNIHSFISFISFVSFISFIYVKLNLENGISLENGICSDEKTSFLFYKM